jgi:hypothetical protein
MNPRAIHSRNAPGIWQMRLEHLLKFSSNPGQTH